MTKYTSRWRGIDGFGGGILALGVLAAFAVAWWLAPTESTMGTVQRIMYLHVPLAWISLLACPAMAALGACYLVRRELRWDCWAGAVAELSWIACTLALVTGSLWARAAWGTWWTWDPRLTTTFILWAIYSGGVLLRRGLADRRRRAQAAAVLAFVGTLDVPLIVMATRWFRGMHPVSPAMEPEMRLALVMSGFAFLGVFAMLLRCRGLQIEAEENAAGLAARLVNMESNVSLGGTTTCLGRDATGVVQ